MIYSIFEIPEIKSFWDLVIWAKGFFIAIGTVAFIVFVIMISANTIRGYARFMEDIKTITETRGRFVFFMIVVCGLALFIYFQIRQFVNF
jgi:hypothetical protein